jgi:hypothetical protein
VLFALPAVAPQRAQVARGRDDFARTVKLDGSTSSSERTNGS